MREALDSHFNASYQSKTLVDEPSLHDVEADIELPLSSDHFMIEGAHGGFHNPNSPRSLFIEDVLSHYASILQESRSYLHISFHMR
ncbi:UNVERIFIED_CONTAM: hypothetical protein Sradi_0866400 [Sesamum radiatum]|uniref:Uncharacterized protein n=1 Tax=Sesamum radiatum TaxID=300843 RepID=A0AAW2V4N9_SESRA